MSRRNASKFADGQKYVGTAPDFEESKTEASSIFRCHLHQVQTWDSQHQSVGMPNRSESAR